jgi:hypothetical protein
MEVIESAINVLIKQPLFIFTSNKLFLICQYI